jgi:hypothetical protein
VWIQCKVNSQVVDGNPRWYKLAKGMWAWSAARYISNVGPAPRYCHFKERDDNHGNHNNGRDNGRDNGRENGRENGRDNGRENGRDNGRESSHGHDSGSESSHNQDWNSNSSNSWTSAEGGN